MFLHTDVEDMVYIPKLVNKLWSEKVPTENILSGFNSVNLLYLGNQTQHKETMWGLEHKTDFKILRKQSCRHLSFINKGQYESS